MDAVYRNIRVVDKKSIETSWIFYVIEFFLTSLLKNVNLTELRESVVHFKYTLLSNTNSVPINELKWLFHSPCSFEHVTDPIWNCLFLTLLYTFDPQKSYFIKHVHASPWIAKQLPITQRSFWTLDIPLLSTNFFDFFGNFWQKAH